MKTYILTAAILWSVGLGAQDLEPTFEKDGNRVKATYYHENGAVAQKGHFYNGKLHGDWTMFDEQGNKIASGAYEDGIRTGTWFFWEDETVKEVNFADNRIAEVVEKNKDGTIVKN